MQAEPAETQAIAEPEPLRLTEPIPVELEAIPAGKAKALQIFAAALKADAVGHIPHYEKLAAAREDGAGARRGSSSKARRGFRSTGRSGDNHSGKARFENSHDGGARAKELLALWSLKETAGPTEAEVAAANREQARLNREQAKINGARPDATPEAPPKTAQIILKQREPNRIQPGAERDLAEVNREQAKIEPGASGVEPRAGGI